MKNFKLAAIIVAAALLVIGAAMTSQAAKYNWVQEDGAWYYVDEDGVKQGDVMVQWPGSNDYYYFDEYGELVADYLFVDDDEKATQYYFGENGAMVRDAWVLYAEEDSEDEYYYYFDAKGKGYKSTNEKGAIKAVHGVKYVFNNDGKLQTGWLDENYISKTDEDNTAYGSAFAYAGTDGALRVQTWEKITVESGIDEKDVWFYFQKGLNVDPNASSACTVGKKLEGVGPVKCTWGSESGYFAFDSNGCMITGWDTIPASADEKAGKIQSFYYDGNGYLKTEWFKAYAVKSSAVTDDDEEYVYYQSKDRTGLLKNVVKKIDSKTYGFDENGRMMTGVWYLSFTSDTAIATPGDAVTEWSTLTAGDNLVALGNSNYYYFGDKADMLTDGAMKTGAVNVSLKNAEGDKTSKTMTFSSTGATKGKAIEGYKNGYFYHNGVKVTASADAKYEIFKITDISDDSTPIYALSKVTAPFTNYDRAIMNKKGDEQIGKGVQKGIIKGFLNDDDKTAIAQPSDNDEEWIVLSSTGTVVSGKKLDGNDFYLVTRKATDAELTAEAPVAKSLGIKYLVDGIYYLYD